MGNRKPRFSLLEENIERRALPLVDAFYSLLMRLNQQPGKKLGNLLGGLIVRGGLGNIYVDLASGGV
jgi:hypothetical protein